MRSVVKGREMREGSRTSGLGNSMPAAPLLSSPLSTFPCRNVLAVWPAPQVARAVLPAQSLLQQKPPTLHFLPLPAPADCPAPSTPLAPYLRRHNLELRSHGQQDEGKLAHVAQADAHAPGRAPGRAIRTHHQRHQRALQNHEQCHSQAQHVDVLPEESAATHKRQHRAPTPSQPLQRAEVGGRGACPQTSLQMQIGGPRLQHRPCKSCRQRSFAWIRTETLMTLGSKAGCSHLY